MKPVFPLLAMILLFAATPLHAQDWMMEEEAAEQDGDSNRDLEGGAQIQFGQNWGWFRVQAGPRWNWGNFSMRPYGALGLAFLEGVAGQPTTLGAYLDLDYAIPVGGGAIVLGPGGGIGGILGLPSPLLQSYVQAAYRWNGNIIGVQGILGNEIPYPVTGINRLNLTGIGLRFEYVIDKGW